MARFLIHQHRQLLNRRGELVAGGGESVPADHPDVLELEDPASVGRVVEDRPAPVPPADLRYVPEKADEAAVEAPAPRFRHRKNTE